MSDNELGIFLRGRRESITPSQVGLPTGPRRRTPGLRRAELATLAGVSVEYLTRLEQGRDRRPSAQVLGALGDALRLPVEERVHLHRLAKTAEGGLSACSMTPPAHTVRRSVRAVLERLEPAPAVLLNRLSDVLAHTAGFERLARPLGVLDGPSPNLLRHIFTDARARDAFPDWERVADEHVAHFKHESHPGDEHFAHLADELTIAAGGAFGGRMERVVGLPPRTGLHRIEHPTAGGLLLDYEVLALAEDQRLVVYLPADDATSTALERLAGRRPGALRAVTG
ncbi:helix-turn-helix domain-containing protein [Actinomadura viridis]|uniref:helix-turn-helix domain-containing protein n=1 Tax=Actinomadura viridis TaxID=58110 RepID=UPI0036BD54CB